MHAAVDNVAGLAALAEQHLPELGESAPQSTAAMIMAVGAVWTHARPSPAMLAAYEADPSLTAFQLDFTTALQEKPATLIAGTIARASAWTRSGGGADRAAGVVRWPVATGDAATTPSYEAATPPAPRPLRAEPARPRTLVLPGGRSGSPRESNEGPARQGLFSCPHQG